MLRKQPQNGDFHQAPAKAFKCAGAEHGYLSSSSSMSMASLMGRPAGSSPPLLLLLAIFFFICSCVGRKESCSDTMHSKWNRGGG
eukprot:scaffold84934_cov56-Prasinocladus_malaysianus.AAC.1